MAKVVDVVGLYYKSARKGNGGLRRREGAKPSPGPIPGDVPDDVGHPPSGAPTATSATASPPCSPRSPSLRATIIGELHHRHRAVEFEKFLVTIDKAVPTELDMHRFHMHFSRTGSSWINQVEWWFSLSTDELVRRGVRTSARALEQDITPWIENWNQNPESFTWNKTADEIVNSLAAYLATIIHLATKD
ncbi:hypothetical protein [Amycolatopsis pithecellobii]|uniref:Tc1-like transposase DDE domain-containing protein n=1 Tax=Amycolatopsis pithecellobii TaxID=664692 RepID=A0A6N7Z4Z6_9PSEU|nr:hypothetical protein [Amycolatopsis pithecellobii]MTD55490.1 hypothetical protein [Amycolatopsis pithecellobii]